MLTKKSARYFFSNHIRALKEESTSTGNTFWIRKYFISRYVKLSGDNKEIITDMNKYFIIYLISYKSLKMKSIIIGKSTKDAVIELLKLLENGINESKIQMLPLSQSEFIKNLINCGFVYKKDL